MIPADWPHAGSASMVAAVVAIAAVTVLLAQGAHAAGAAEAPPGMASPPAPHRATSIAFPASVPVGGTGLITVSYASPPTSTLPPDSGGAGGGFVLLRFPSGIEVASPGYAVYPGTVEMGGLPGEFAVFHAKKALSAAGAGEAIRTVEIEIRVSEPPVAPRNFVDVRVVGNGGDSGAAAVGALAVLETSGGTVHFDVQPAPATAGSDSDSAESAPARDLPAGPNSAAPLPPPAALAAHLARALPPGADAVAWLAENAARLPADYREETAAEYRRLAGDTPLGAGGASGQSFAPLQFPSLSSYVYGTLYSRASNGTLGVQPGASVCMYDVGDDNRTLTLLDNLADPADPRGACTATDGTGFFDMSVLTLDPTDPLSDVDLRMVFAADGPLYRVADAGNRTYELHAVTVGNLSDAVRGFNVTVPDGHKFRRAMWVGDAIAAGHARFGSEFGHAAPKADVRWDPALPDGSSYNHTSGTMTVSSVHARAGAQHGAEAVPASILHEYAHHVMAHARSQVGDAPACPGHLRIDRPHSEECAWTDGWAHFAAAAMLGSRTLEYHHLPLAVNLEAPAYDVGGRHVYGFAAGADVPGNVAGALWDLYDSADEPGDSVSGAGTAVWNATLSMRHGTGAGGNSGSPSILDFRQAWIGGAGNASIRGVLELNGIDVPPDAPPALAASNASIAVPYGETARTTVDSTATGPAVFGLGPYVANNTGHAAPPPAFANMTYRYAGSGVTTAMITLAPNASDIGSYALNVTARMPHGLSNHTIIYIDVTDAVPPYFASVPWDVAVEATGNLTAINATLLGVVAYDEADANPHLSHSPAGPLFLGSHYIRWTATDASNNSASATMYLVVQDTTPPAFEGAENVTLAFAPGAQPAAYYSAPSATDLVDGPVHASCWPRQGSPIPWGPTTVTCDASDRHGNYAWALFVVNATRDDSLGGPEISASNSTVAVGYDRTAYVEVNATGAGPAAMSLASSYDGLGNATVPPPAFANLTYRYDAVSGTTAALITLVPNASDVGLHMLNVTARTAHGLSNHTIIHVNVTDTIRPYFASVPWDVFVEATGRLTAINATLLGVVAYDEADPRPVLVHSPAGPLSLGGHYVRWTATDASNNSATATMYLVVRDTTPPAFEGVENTTLAFAPGVQPVAAYRVPNATDLVDGPVHAPCWPRQGSPVQWGQTTVTCDASDRHGNYVWYQFTINATANGTLAPPALAASNSTVVLGYNRTVHVEVNATGAGPAAMSLAAAHDGLGNHAAPPPAFANMTYWYNASSGTTTALITLAPNASDVGSYILNVTARTPLGLSNHTTIKVNVTDAVPPYFASVPWDVAVEATGRLTAINATLLGVAAYDEADPDPALSHSPAGPLPVGDHYIRWTATDASNNSASATMYLVVQDTTPPEFEGVENTTLAFAPGVLPVAAYRVPNATDLVDGPVNATCRPAPYSPIPYGSTTVTCDAADRSGNYAWAQFTIDAAGNGTLAPPALAASNSSVTVAYDRTAYVEVNATGAGPTFVELAAFAGSGRLGNGAAAVPPPAFANMTYWYNASSGTTTALVTLAPNASDVGPHVLNVSARTPHGLSNHTIIRVNVTDAVPPYFASVPWDIAVEATGNLTAINATRLGVVAYDEADPHPVLSYSPAGPLPVGDHYIRWTATDASNNSVSAAMRLFIVDTMPPSFSGVPRNMSLAMAGSGDSRALYAPPNATDLVDGAVPVDCSPPPSYAPPVRDGPILVECDASDRSGNSAAVRFWINATREGGPSAGGGGAQPPRLTLSNSSVAVPYNGTAAVRASAAAAAGAEGPPTVEIHSIDPLGRTAPAPAFASVEYAGAGGNHTEALVVLSPNATDVGIHRINVTAHWRGGLLPAHAILLVNVTDGIPPALHVPARAALEAAGNLTRINATELGVWAFDEADPSPALYSSPPGPLPVGDHHVQWTATDASNNSASAWMRLSVHDTTPPVFGAAPNVTLAFLGGAAPWADYTVPAAFDAVDGANVRVSCSPSPGSPVQWGLTQVACVALDSHGNIAWARFWLNATGSGGQGG